MISYHIFGSSTWCKGLWTSDFFFSTSEEINLSLGGRLVLDGIPTYVMSLLPIPASVERRINRVRNRFLWEGNPKKRRMHLVKWNDVMFGQKGR